MNKRSNIMIVVLVIIIGLLLWNVFSGRKITPNKVSDLKAKVEVKYRLIDSVTYRTETIRKELVHRRQINDTVGIIQYQDSLIITQDTHIVYLQDVIHIQDTIITTLEQENKDLNKKNRRKNIRNIGIAAIGSAIITYISTKN